MSRTDAATPIPRAVPPGTAPVARPAREQPPARATTLISSEQLFAGASEVQISHHGALYRLKKTSLGKLILTK